MTRAQPRRGADALIHCLQQAGVKTVYALSGNHIMPIFDAAIASGIEFIHVRHEAAAVHMADAAARLTGRPAVALVTGGPGHANAVSALYVALQAESPVILISGHASSSQLGKGAFQEMDQQSLAAPCAKASILVQSANELSQQLHNALQIAASARPGPVSVSITQDALDGFTSDAARRPHLQPPQASDRPAPLAAWTDIAARIDNAKRPLIVTGPQMLQPVWRQTVQDLQSCSNVAVIGMESPRGMNDPALGRFASLASNADLVVLLGKRLDFTLKFADPSAFSAQAQFIVIDPDQSSLQRAHDMLGKRAITLLPADAPSAAQALIGQAYPSRTSRSIWFSEVQAAIDACPEATENPAATPMHPATVIKPFADIAKQHDVIMVSDGGEFGQWAQALLRPFIRIINGPAGGIGGAIPMAIAAAHEHPNALVLAFMGDGAFGFHATEFETAVRYRKRFICVVGNDACWNAEYQIQLRNYGPDRLMGCELSSVSYDQVAKAYGAKGCSVHTANEVSQAIAQALASDQAYCINAFISRSAAPSLK